ncbi:hypothetical protein ACI65C_010676 [Semiaphis heraclei]
MFQINNKYYTVSPIPRHKIYLWLSRPSVGSTVTIVRRLLLFPCRNLRQPTTRHPSTLEYSTECRSLSFISSSGVLCARRLRISNVLTCDNTDRTQRQHSNYHRYDNNTNRPRYLLAKPTTTSTTLVPS